jgi:lambda family phage portal protein
MSQAEERQVKANFLDRAIAYVAPGLAARRLASRVQFDVYSEFKGAEISRLRAGWALGRTNTTPMPYSLQMLRNRSRDLNRNDPVARSATDTMGLNIVGRGLRPQSRLRADRLGISQDKARVLQRQVEAIFESWAPFADSGNRLNFDELQFLALRKILEDGEVLALPVRPKELWRPLGWAVELLETDRLVSWGAKTTTGNMSGVEVGQRGEPLRYWISPVDYQNQVGGAYNLLPPVPVEARDPFGRPKVLHLFRAERPGQLRGIPFFAPVVNYFKDLADYLEAEVVAAKVAACLAVFISKQDPLLGAPPPLPGTGNGQGGNANQRYETLDPGTIMYGQLGEKAEMIDFKRALNFSSFVDQVMRVIGMALGLPYELLVKDFSKTNYSSARASLLEARRMFTTMRYWFAAKFCQPFWELLLEEAYLDGLFAVPNFYKFRAEYCRCAWVGGAWGWVDPIKEKEAAKLGIDWGLDTYASVASEQGEDWEELLMQRALEEEFISELGLVIPQARAKQVAQAETAPAPDQPGGGQQ